MRLAILGGGGFRVPLVCRAVAARPELAIDEIVLYDVDPARLRVIAAVVGPQLPVRLTTSLEAAVRGVDFIFCAVRVGGTQARARDERRALELGLLGQETVGAAGLAFGLRTLPVALDIASTIARLAPAAWTINFTNPAGMITEAMRTVLGDRVIGICDSPAGLVRRAGRALHVPGADADYVGINHLGWLRALRVNGVDELPMLLADEAALSSFEEGRLFGACLLRMLGSVPNEYAYFYYCAPDVVASLLATDRTRGEVVHDDQLEFYAAASASPGEAALLWADARATRERSYLSEARPFGEHRDEIELAGGGYEQVALDLLAALSGRAPNRLIVNVANGMTLPQLPAHTVIEVPCLVDSSGARPLPTSPLDLHQLGLVASVRAAESAIVSAAMSGSRQDALRAFTIHPLIPSPALAAAVLERLLAEEPAVARRIRAGSGC